ncbi:class V lanthionine synthetase subunit LxmK [Streptomyces sp. S.PNR 29]|uniref:class V lanthionine synthetase subunit LxmK n=1 Tax=Streptomyces sp. S.PNR 29 TaxID=2973805 RepID=UPI0025AFE75B|nr:class V lanthionine synthetase subunit LxmK [Streptomyces sp. S.PNR 29]MDN0194000.1 class V lanthionine synthetase subunit LxmK [Streptomyces sp. S.PNR 29]
MTEGTTTLDETAAVDDLLIHTGLGSLAGQTDVRKLPGRNQNWIGTTDTGKRVFVKKLEGHPQASAARVRQCLAFDRILRKDTSTALRSPQLLAADPEKGVLVFARVDDARTAAELIREEQLTSELAYSLGRTVGLLHDLPVAELPHDEEISPLLPTEELLEAIPAALFEASSAAELQAWSLMQNDAELGDALRRLLSHERLADRVAAHCDLRLDQFLISDGTVHLTDFEEFRAGDPARDLGGVVGDLLHRALLDAAAGDRQGEEPPSRDRMLARLTEGIRKVRPQIMAFWNGYRDTRDSGDDQLAERVTAFVGWHLLDRLLAGARTAPRLAALPRAMAGIGRKALLTPAAFQSTLGLTEARA